MTDIREVSGVSEPSIVVSVDAVSDSAAFHARAESVIASGFVEMECPYSSDGLVSAESTEASCRELAAALRARGARVRVLRFESPVDDLTAGVSAEGLVNALDRAAWLGADHVMIPSAAWETGDETDHETLYSELLRTMLSLRFAAQTRSVTLCLEAPTPRLFRSPLELRRFIDRVNSPWVGVALCCTQAAREGGFASWRSSLGWRVMAVLADDDAAVEGAILATGQSIGVIICRGPESARRVRQAMKSRNPSDR